MYRLALVIIIFLVSSFAYSEGTDPCTIDSHPIVNRINVKHATDISEPTVFIRNGDAKVIVETSEIIRQVSAISNKHIPYLNESIERLEHVLLGNKSSSVDISVFEPDPTKQKGKGFQIAVNNYGFVSGAIQKALFESKALVLLNEKIVESSEVTLRIGKDPQPLDEYVNVHKLNFISNGKIVYESCWLDK